MNVRIITTMCLLLSSAAGCQIGPVALKVGHAQYADAVRRMLQLRLSNPGAGGCRRGAGPPLEEGDPDVLEERRASPLHARGGVISDGTRWRWPPPWWCWCLACWPGRWRWPWPRPHHCWWPAGPGTPPAVGWLQNRERPPVPGEPSHCARGERGASVPTRSLQPHSLAPGKPGPLAARLAPPGAREGRRQSPLAHGEVLETESQGRRARLHPVIVDLESSLSPGLPAAV